MTRYVYRFLLTNSYGHPYRMSYETKALLDKAAAVKIGEGLREDYPIVLACYRETITMETLFECEIENPLKL